jgi:yersiniabactin salicyl-AMP ligase
MTNNDFSFWSDSENLEYEQLGYWQPHTLGECLRQWAQRRGDDIALVEQQARFSYSELDAHADHLAWGLADLGIQRGDRVLLQLPNGIPFVSTLFALFRLGALPILAMPAQRQNDLSALCELAQPVAYIGQARFLGFDYASMANQLAAQRPSLANIILEGGDGLTLKSLAHSGQRLGMPKGGLPLLSHRDPALLLLSGGTTGTPKLIPRTHADYAYNARASAALCGLNEHSVYLAALPIAHNFPLACPGVLGTLSVGGTAVLAHTPGPDECFELIQRERVNFTALVPPLAHAWLEAREWDTTDLSSLEVLQVGGARCESVLAARITPGLGCRLQQVFGMAEGLLCYTRLDDPEDQVLHTQGRPLCAHDEVRLVNEQGEDVAPGEIGELLTRGPYTLRGYYRATEQNARSFTPDGFYRSGDLARRNAAGNLIVEGRIKEQINRAGEKIATEEVEQALCFHPAITSAALVGLADPRLGERGCAFLISNDHHLTLAQVRAFLCERGLPAYKCPDQIEFVSHWPLTPIGKVDKRRLAQRLNPATTANAQTVYLEREVAINAAPIEIATALLAEADDYLLYERDEVWNLGLGRHATLRATADSVSLEQAAEHLTWPTQTLADGIARTLAALPLQGWRAYGSADFELAQVFHDSHRPEPEQTLLELVIPVMEVRVGKGRAVLRALSQAALNALASQVADADRQCQQQPATTRLHSRPRLAADIDHYHADDYREQVASAVAEINAGLYQKVILSRKVPVAGTPDLVASYLLGRTQNTPARSFLLQRGQRGMLGFSPETVVEVDAHGAVSTQPLAGTRAMGEHLEQTLRLRHELLCDVKEIAEHAVSVKLALEELLPICVPGSVRVSEFMTVSERGPVQHLASRVNGQLAEHCGPWAAFQALFPAVTASGIPKRPALDAIHRHEGAPRGAYSGCVMIVDSDGTLDAALVLRSLFLQGQRAWLQAGAGIVGQSTPERELRETIEKLSSVSRCLVAATESQGATNRFSHEARPSENRVAETVDQAR